jgi:outer membrane protein TolC
MPITNISFYTIALFVLSLSCRTPELSLKDNQIEPLIERTYKANTDALKHVLSKSSQNIDDLFILALDRSEKLAISSEDVYQSRERTRQAWGAIMPQISFRMGLYAPDNTGSTTGGSFFTNGFRFYARQTILTGLDEITAIQTGKLQENFSLEMFQTQAADLYDQIAQVFFQYLLVQESLKTEKLLLENTLDLKLELERRLRLGKIRRSELLNTEVLIAKTEAIIGTLEDTLKNIESETKKLTGMDNVFSPELEVSYEDIDLSVYKNNFQYLTNRPDLASLKIQWELSRHESNRTLGGHVPKIYLEGSYRLPADSSSEGDYYGALVAEVPLFSGGQVHSQYLSAKSKERQAKLRYDEALRTASETYNYFISSFETGKNILKMQKFAFEKARNSYLVILADYRIGQATNLEVLSALSDHASAGLEYEKTRLNQQLNLLRIKILAGELPSRNHVNLKN